MTAALLSFLITNTNCIKLSSYQFTSSPSSSSVLESSNIPHTIKLHRPLLDGGKIIGGYPLDLNDIPGGYYQVSLRVISHKCGGILIGKNWILTSGHCTNHLQPYHYKIYMGSNVTNNKNGLTVRATELYRHPNYTKNLDYDFTLIKLADYNASGHHIAIANLPEPNEEILNGTELQVFGWDKNQNPKMSKEILKSIEFITINATECNEVYDKRGGITDRMFCANTNYVGETAANDICQGDSGGAVINGNKAIGVVSWGYGCAKPKYPIVFAKIASVRDWIKDTCGI